MNQKYITKFHTKYQIDPATGCWNWTGPLTYSGYPGTIGYLPAHRFSSLIHGKDPKDKLVCHSCDNPCCVNPDHLFLGTHGDNMRDRTAKGRTSQGENHYRSKLTNEQRRQIVAEFPQVNQLYGTVVNMARHYGIERTNLYRVAKKRH